MRSPRVLRFVGQAGDVRLYVYRPALREARGVYLIAPGLHYAGPDDPRLDRFCRVLAHAGFVVVAPFLPDFLALRIAPSTTAHLAAAFDHAVAIADAEELEGPAVFSISFGSRPAIELCAEERGRRATRLVLFGGFCDFDATVRFAITGRAEHEGLALILPHDPLNAPVVHLNLLPFHDEIDRDALAPKLRAMVEATWGRPELKVGDARAAHARPLAEALAERERAFFMEACGLVKGGEERLVRALANARDAFAWADPRPFLARVHPPVSIVHGRDDDVIPWPQAHALQRALPSGHPHELIFTGLYGHTAVERPSPRALVSELSAMWRVVRAMSGATRARP